MKAILEFDLDLIEEEEKFRVVSKALDWYFVCLDLDKELRDMIKYRKAPKAVEKVRELFHSIMEQRGVSLEDMS